MGDIYETMSNRTLIQILLGRILDEVNSIFKLMRQKTDDELNSIKDPYIEEFDCNTRANLTFLKLLISRKCESPIYKESKIDLTDEEIIRYVIKQHIDSAESLHLEYLARGLQEEPKLFLPNTSLYQQQ